MPWLIVRTAPNEPSAYWGQPDRWIVRRRPLRFAQILDPVPTLANRYHSYDAAFDVAEWLRTNQPLAHGEVIAVVSEVERPK